MKFTVLFAFCNLPVCVPAYARLRAGRRTRTGRPTNTLDEEDDGEGGGSKPSNTLLQVDAGRQDGDFNVQHIDVFLLVLSVNLHHRRCFGRSPLAYRLTFHDHAFGLDRLSKVYKGIRADYTDVFLRTVGVHLAKSTAQRLLENVALS